MIVQGIPSILENRSCPMAGLRKSHQPCVGGGITIAQVCKSTKTNQRQRSKKHETLACFA